LAKSLTAAFIVNSEMQAKTITECNKKFDGDRNVLCSTLFSQSISNSENGKTSKTNSISTFGELLNKISIDNQLHSFKTNIDFANSILASDSLIQLYFYIAKSSDSTSVEGIIIRPEYFDSNSPMNILVIKSDGSQAYIPSNVDPEANYLVVSRNERGGKALVSNSALEQTYKTQSTRATKITRAQFTSMSAMRAVEPFMDGEPEMQLKLIYTSGTSATIQEGFWTLPGGHWITGTWLKQSPQWQYFTIEMPLWDNLTQSADRKLIWIEHDSGDPISYSDSFEGKSVSYTLTKSDQIVSASYLDFSDYSVLHTWGGIRFDVN